MSDGPRHIDTHAKRHALKITAVALATVLAVLVAGVVLVYRHLEGNITQLDVTKQLGNHRPKAVVKQHVAYQPMNILLLGSDTRQGRGNHIGGDTPGLSDTTIILHLSADRKHAYGISIPRDSMVQRPPCLRKDGNGTDPGGLSMFNEAYAVGGPGCTQKTLEQLTGIRFDHFVVVDFNGFKTMVDALGGVEVCVPTAVHDTVGHIDLPAGTYNVTGNQALDYVRVRHAISENGDIGRMKRQQAFLAAMANKAVSMGTLANPVRLYNFLDAATKSLTTDPGLANLKTLADLANQLRSIGLSQIQFLTVPFETYQPDPNRLQWAPSANRLWYRIRNDLPLTHGQSRDVTTAAAPTPGASPSPGRHLSAAEAARRAELARENGLCA
jgi:LCP family protein required for cell wall assembly